MLKVNKCIFTSVLALSFLTSTGFSFYTEYQNDITDTVPDTYVEASSEIPVVNLHTESMIKIPDSDILELNAEDNEPEVPKIYNVSLVEVPKITLSTESVLTSEQGIDEVIIADEIEDSTEQSDTSEESQDIVVVESHEAIITPAEDTPESMETGIVIPFENVAGPEHITKQSGTFAGPSGKETYYNLNMSGCVSIMRNLGYSEDEYPVWTRDDGVKMFGYYVMVAANTYAYPKGTVIETSMGTAMVVDHCVRAESEQLLDIAVTW